VRSKNDLAKLGPLVKNGNLTIFLVWAKWCPHCHTMMPHFDAAAKSPKRSINAVKVEEQMLPAVNEILSTQVNKAASPLNVEGYPSIIVVDKNANRVTDIEPVRDTQVMTRVMENAGPLANQAGLVNNEENAENVENLLKNKNSITPPRNKNKNKAFLANLGVEEEGMATTSGAPKNIDIGEENLLGNIASVNNKSKPTKLNAPKKNSLSNINQNMATSTLNVPKEVITPPPASIKKLSEEAEEVTSLASPLTPPTAINDLEEVSNVKNISNSLTPEQKLSGGGKANGGSLYSSLARTTYTLAPAAALFATAALVMKGKKNKTHKRSKKSRRSRRNARNRR
jgi:thiol-disulfide isomerase/thioredoxin